MVISGKSRKLYLGYIRHFQGIQHSYQLCGFPSKMANLG